VIILTLFGTTVGLKVLHLPLTKVPTTVKLEDAWIEISGGQMTVRPDKDGFVVLRKMVGPHLATWIGLYRPAREIGYDRSGGFYGAGAWLIDSVVDVALLTHVIRNLADQIRSVAMTGDRFTKCILEARAEFVQPPQTAEMIASLGRTPIAGCNPAGGNAFVVAGNNSLEIIEWAQRALTASVFSRVFVGTAEHAPDGGVSSSTQFFRSLPLALEGVYQRAYTELAATRNELEQSKLQVRKSQVDYSVLQAKNLQLQDRSLQQEDQNRNLLNNNYQLDDKNRELESAINNLKRSLIVPKPMHGGKPQPGGTGQGMIRRVEANEIYYVKVVFGVFFAVAVLAYGVAIYFNKPGCPWYLPLCSVASSPIKESQALDITSKTDPDTASGLQPAGKPTASELDSQKPSVFDGKVPQVDKLPASPQRQ
jgi:hypothetical protein